MTVPQLRVAGVILAGGQSRRMGGGNKCLLPLGGIPLLQHARNRLEPQATRLAISANADPALFADFALPVLADATADFCGPLAGILAAMRWAQNCNPPVSHIVSVPGDSPFFPRDLVAQLCAAALEAGAPLACAASGGRAHPVFGLWSLHLADDLQHALHQEKLRKIDFWTRRHGIAETRFDTEPFDPFFNINHPDDLGRAADILASVQERQP